MKTDDEIRIARAAAGIHDFRNSPHEWHFAPAGEVGPCSICASAVSGQRQHRRAHSDRMWIARGKTRPVVPAPASTPNL